jgi:hypothetical protein
MYNALVNLRQSVVRIDLGAVSPAAAGENFRLTETADTLHDILCAKTREMKIIWITEHLRKHIAVPNAGNDRKSTSGSRCIESDPWVSLS